MNFTRRVFFWAGVYGLVVLVPQYFMEARIGRDFPPPITHPENFYGFIGVAVAWQVAFLMISRDPARYRLLMVPGILEKFAFGGAVVILYLGGRVSAMVFGAGCIDLVLGLLFFIAFRRTVRSAL